MRNQNSSTTGTTCITCIVNADSPSARVLWRESWMISALKTNAVWTLQLYAATWTHAKVACLQQTSHHSCPCASGTMAMLWFFLADGRYIWLTWERVTFAPLPLPLPLPLPFDIDMILMGDGSTMNGTMRLVISLPECKIVSNLPSSCRVGGHCRTLTHVDTRQYVNELCVCVF